MRIALKLAAALLAGIVLVLAGAMIVQVRREATLFESDMARDDTFIGQRVAAAAAAIRRTEGDAAAEQFIREEDQADSAVAIRHVTEIEPLGDERAAGLRAALGGQAQVWIDRAGQPPVLHTFVPVPGTPGSWGALELTESLGPERQYVRSTIWRHVATAGAIAAVCGAIGLALGVYLVGSPVGRMVAVARRIGQGDLTGRLAPSARDELAQLGREIDAMSDQLGLARERLTAETAARIATLEQLRRADRLATVGKLASGIAHELGTPLNVVAARAKMIESEEVRGAEARESASIVAEQSARMTRIIRQLLDFARPRRPAREPTDLAQLVQQAANLLHPIAKAAGVTVRAENTAGPVAAPVDGGQMTQVVSNLIVNAVHASPRGQEVVVSAAFETAGPPADIGGGETRVAVIRVRDRGAGISRDDLVHLFEPFFTTKDVGQGTGLGLSISNGIVREHGGWIDVASTPGEGSVFSVFIPLGV